jgi:hypothetical protein
LLNVCVLAFAPAVSCCTQIRIYSPNAVAVHNVVGIIQIELQPTAASTYIETAGAGVVAGQSHVAIGWMDEAVMLMPNPSDCQAVIVVKSSEELKHFEDVLRLSQKDLSHICTRKGPKT